MRRMYHYTGVLKAVKPLPGETLEQQCKRLLGKEGENEFNRPLGIATYQDWLNYRQYGNEYTVQNGIVYKIEAKEVPPDKSLYRANIRDNGDIEFEVLYNDVHETLPKAIKKAVTIMEGDL